MKKIGFIALAIIGIIDLSLFSFIVPKDPFKVIPAITVMSFDKPLWFCIMIGGSFLYLLILYSIFDCFNQTK